MSYYIVNVGTDRAWGKSYWLKQEYATERGAKIACTKMNTKIIDAAAGLKETTQQWKVMPRSEYNARPVKMVERINLQSGQKYMEAEDTPNFCSPASETYWST